MTSTDHKWRSCEAYFVRLLAFGLLSLLVPVLMMGSFFQIPKPLTIGHFDRPTSSAGASLLPPPTLKSPPPDLRMPRPPSNLTCALFIEEELPEGRYRLSAAFTGRVDPRRANQVAFDLFIIHPNSGEKRRLFLSVTAVPSLDRTVKATLSSLTADTDLHSLRNFKLGGRAHAHSPEEGNPVYWTVPHGGPHKTVPCQLMDSRLEEEWKVRWKAASGPDLSEKHQLDESKLPKSHTFEVYRMVDTTQIYDFLDQHNGADLLGTAWHLIIRGSQNNLWSRYCVTVADAALDDITTNSLNGSLSHSAFADYVSCDGGHCRCLLVPDRTIARMPLHKIDKVCKRGVGCKCSNKSLEQSAQYVGRLPIKLPARRSKDPWHNKEYPPPFVTGFEANWYSFPAASRCGHNQRLGDNGCTWRREAPIAHLFGDDVTDIFQGLNTVIDKDRVVEVNASTDTMLHNMRILEARFASLPLRLPPCR